MCGGAVSIDNQLVTIPIPEVDPSFEDTLFMDDGNTINVQYMLYEVGIGPLVTITTGGAPRILTCITCTVKSRPCMYFINRCLIRHIVDSTFVSST